jgi:hypothetical protein
MNAQPDGAAAPGVNRRERLLMGAATAATANLLAKS